MVKNRMKKREVEAEFETEKGRARLRHEPILSNQYTVRIFLKTQYMPTTSYKQTRAEAMQLIRENLL
jgi:hypothetical protein